MKKHICSIMVVAIGLAMGQDAFAELRVWKDDSGKTIEAEYVRTVDGKVLLRQKDGSEIKVSLDTLSEKDRRYAILQVPPRIEIKVSTDTDRENNGLGGVNLGMGGGRGTGVQIQKESVQLRVSLRKTSPAPYEGPLMSEVYLIGYSGQQDDYVILDRTMSRFTLTTENKNQHSYSSGLVNLKQLEAGKLMGLQYKGYLAIVKDRTGEVLAMKSSKLDFEKNAKVIMGALRGARFDADFKPVVAGKAKRTEERGGMIPKKRFPGRPF
jgi:hypothetical protein